MMELFWQHFSKRTILLIVALLILTGGLFYLAVREDQPQPSLAPTTTPSPAHATLTFVPEASTSSTLQRVAVVATSNENKLSGAQLDISYDPQVLTNVTITSGNYFTNPTILFNSIDKTNGRISYVLGISPNGQSAIGSGTVATISYTLSPTASASTTLAFLPKTEVTQLGIVGSVLKTARNLVIQIPTALRISPTPVQSGQTPSY